MLDVSLLGTGGMMPLPNRFLTSLLLRFKGRMLMIDCGEGTQVAMKILGWGFKNVDAMCFTHFQGDHMAGLPGLLLTIGNSGREEPLALIGPEGLGRIVSSLCVIAQEVPFELKIFELPHKPGNTPAPVGVGEFEIKACPMDHRIPCFGYSFEFKRAGRFSPEKAKLNNVPMAYWSRLQKGELVDIDGFSYTPGMILGPPRKSIKVTYCTDSRPVAALPDFAKGSDLLICEGLYGEIEKLDKAIAHKHMIFQEAARVAKEAEVKELWLTHFSPSLTSPEAFVPEARKIFEATVAGKDRMSKTIKYEDE
jgi:ribonuclease Z